MAKTRAEEIAKEDEEAYEANKKRFAKEKKKRERARKARKKTLTKRIYTGGIFEGPGKIKKRKKKSQASLLAKYRKDKKDIKESPDWDNTHDDKLNKLLDKYLDYKDRTISQSDKDRDLIENYGLRGARSRSFMTERGERYNKEYARGGGVRKTKLVDY